MYYNRFIRQWAPTPFFLTLPDETCINFCGSNARFSRQCRKLNPLSSALFTMTEKNFAATFPEKPEIDYPCSWMYKVIGEDTEILREVILTACAPAAVRITHSHSSSGGKYHCLNATLKVESEEMRLQIYELLKAHPAVKIIL